MSFVPIDKGFDLSAVTIAVNTSADPIVFVAIAVSIANIFSLFSIIPGHETFFGAHFCFTVSRILSTSWR